MDIITYALCKKAIQKSIETLGDIFTLKGNVSSISELPSSGNEPGDIYLVGPAQDGSYDEYYWTSEGAWEAMGSTKAGFDGVITENDLYKGENGTGTIENPAEGTILDIVKDMDSYIAGDNIDISNNIISVLGDTIKKVTTSTFNISTAAAGIYQLPQGCTINSDASYTTISTSILIVDSKSGSMVDKAWYLFDGSTGDGRRIVYGYLQGSIGSYVQTTLDQLERNTLKVSSLSSSSTNKQYPSAKCVYDNLQLKANNTTFVGTDGTAGGEKGLVPAPTSQDSDKYLKSDGTWAIPGEDEFVNKSGDTMTGKLIVPTISVGNNNTVDNGCVGEGDHVQARNMNSHAEGYYTHAYGKNSHAEGDYSTASGEDAHAEGYTTVAQARYSHAEGNSTDALSQSQHVQGEWNVQDHSGTASTRGTYAHIVGNGTRESARSNAHTLDWSGNAWFAGDVYVGSTSGTDKDSGSKKLATDDIFGGTNGTNAGTKGLVPAPTASDTDKYLKSDGTWATVSGGSGNYVSKTGDTMTGTLITPNLVVGSQKSGTTLGTKATILGNEGSSLGNYSTVEGSNCVAKDDACHAEGYKCIAGAGQNGGDYSHAEGCNTTASGFCSHSEGYYTTASEYYTHAEGEKTVAAGTHSHAEGYGTKANRGFTHVQGIYNILDDTGAGDTKGTYAHIVGNGSADNNRKNIHTIKWTGEAWFQGDVYVGSTGGKNKDSGSKKLATEEYVRNLLQEFATLNNLNMPD